MRLNDGLDRLYVKTRGSAGAIWYETWLHEYDLKGREERFGWVLGTESATG